ncbi:MAG: hypothetical protein BYD32DRAFT_404346, partial [Podila humilis]
MVVTAFALIMIFVAAARYSPFGEDVKRKLRPRVKNEYSMPTGGFYLEIKVVGESCGRALLFVCKLTIFYIQSALLS